MIGVLNYGMGNIGSILKKLEALSVKSCVVENEKEIEKVDKIILPGVGHFAKAMNSIKSKNLISALNESVLIKNKPILGICLGMQLLGSFSEEGNSEGLGWIEGEVKKFRIEDKYQYKSPHTGWNTAEVSKNSSLMKNINNQDFYFVHSYHFHCKNQEDILTETTYCYKFTSAIERNNIFGTQFHPEKSHKQGELLIKNFTEI